MTSINTASLLLLVPLLCLDCQQPAEPGEDGTESIVLFSFESDADTSGWTGYGGYRFVADAPTGGGSRSLEVSGGCIVPHAVCSLIVPRDGAKLTLALWGKNLASGGSVGVRRAGGADDELFIVVSDTAWTPYRVTAPFACRGGDRLILELMSGGIVYGAMRVDQMEVRLEE